MNTSNVNAIRREQSLVTERVESVDWSFLQVKVNVFGHRERLALPVLSPGNPTWKTHDHV